MLVATSLMYSTDLYEIKKQKKALDTWRNMGFRVISCNVVEEIKVLKEYFPEVHFVELRRSGKETIGKPLPFIYDILQSLKKNIMEDGEVCGIINSDIFIKNLPPKALEDYLVKKRNIMLILHRYDIVDEEDTEGEYYFSGMDAFFFLSDFLGVFPDKGHMLGRPEWDHWFLLEAVKAGIQIREIKNKIAFHIKHKQRWSASDSNKAANNKEKETAYSGEKYYYETNEIMADLSNRILLKGNYLIEKEEPVIPVKSLYHDIERKELLEWEQDRYDCVEQVESVGLLYFKNQKAYRICALHRELVLQESGQVSLGKIFENGRDKGSILKYVDFKDMDFVKGLGRVYIYPAGRAARLLLDCINTYQIHVLGLVDRDITLQGTVCQGHKIFGPEVLEKKEEYDHVLIVTNLYVKEIYEDLRKIVNKNKLIII